MKSSFLRTEAGKETFDAVLFENVYLGWDVLRETREQRDRFTAANIFMRQNQFVNILQYDYAMQLIIIPKM